LFSLFLVFLFSPFLFAVLCYPPIVADNNAEKRCFNYMLLYLSLYLSIYLSSTSLISFNRYPSSTAASGRRRSPSAAAARRRR
jgi:hypothetical protein